MAEKQSKIFVVVGPTASGKSELAVKLAKKYNGEIISADSRQIYRGLDIGSGKVEGKWKQGTFVYKNIPHYLIDQVSPRGQYSVAKFQKQATKLIADVQQRGKLPIICGGTGHWIDAVVFAQVLPAVKPNTKLRAKLNQMSVKQLFAKLQKLDPERAKTIDSKNPRRLIRALEIVLSTGNPVPKTKVVQKYDALWLGTNHDKETLHDKIEKRLKSRLKQGLIKEVTKLHEQGLSWKKLESFGLEYKFVALYLQNKLSEAEMKEQLLRAIKQYAKRQLTWWKRNQEIHWSVEPEKLLTLAKKLIS